MSNIKHKRCKLQTTCFTPSSFFITPPPTFSISRSTEKQELRELKKNNESYSCLKSEYIFVI